MVTMRSSGPTSLSIARSSVVLPASTPPQTMKFLRARTGGGEELAQRHVDGPQPTRSSRKTLGKRWRRMATDGLAVTAITANRRLPSGSWRLSDGEPLSKRRSVSPTRLRSCAACR